jgi:hypothetical protein
MKKRKIIIPLILFLSFYVSSAQLIMIDGETGDFRYEDVARADGITSSEINLRAKDWLGIYYNQIVPVNQDSIGVEQLNTYSFTWRLIKKNIEVELFFDVNIKVKDNRFKYDFHNFRVGKMTLGDLQAISLKTYIDRFPSEYQIYIEEPIDKEMTKAISSLIYYVNNNKIEVDEDDW